MDASAEGFEVQWVAADASWAAVCGGTARMFRGLHHVLLAVRFLRRPSQRSNWYAIACSCNCMQTDALRLATGYDLVGRQGRRAAASTDRGWVAIQSSKSITHACIIYQLVRGLPWRQVAQATTA